MGKADEKDCWGEEKLDENEFSGREVKDDDDGAEKGEFGVENWAVAILLVAGAELAGTIRRNVLEGSAWKRTKVLTGSDALKGFSVLVPNLLSDLMSLPTSRSS